MHLFTDGSAHPQTKIGFGACLIVADLNDAPADLKNEVQLKRFENTSSTRLEIETLLWALQTIQPNRLTLYTDSQNIIDLPARQERLEKNKYASSTGKPLKNADLYQHFFRIIESIEITFIKVKGHRRSKEKSHIEHLFTLVDRASRKALRSEITSSQ